MGLKTYLGAIFIVAVMFSILIVSGLSGRLYSLDKARIYKSVINNVSGFSSYESFYSRIFYTDSDEIYVDAVANCIDFYAPLLMKDFGIDDIYKITIILFPDGDAMSNSLGLSYEVAPMGVYYGGVINILSPGQWIENCGESYVKERFIKEGPIIHELTHMLTDLKTSGNYPVWFTEGVSLYYEYKYAAFEWREDLKQKSSGITIERLESDFRVLEEAEAYRRSFDIVYDYIEENGERDLQNKMSGFKNVSDARKIFEK